jgi:hygromycin-B 7''-O-kinase
MPKDLYLQPDAPDPVLADAVVLGLVGRHVPDAHAVTSVDENGGEARTHLIDDGFVLKTQRPHRLRPRTSLAKEAAFLRHLAAFPAIPVPRVLGYGQIWSPSPAQQSIVMQRIRIYSSCWMYSSQCAP